MNIDYEHVADMVKAKIKDFEAQAEAKANGGQPNYAMMPAGEEVLARLEAARDQGLLTAAIEQGLAPVPDAREPKKNPCEGSAHHRLTLAAKVQIAATAPSPPPARPTRRRPSHRREIIGEAARMVRNSADDFVFGCCSDGAGLDDVASVSDAFGQDRCRAPGPASVHLLRAGSGYPRARRAQPLPLDRDAGRCLNVLPRI